MFVRIFVFNTTVVKGVEISGLFHSSFPLQTPEIGCLSLESHLGLVGHLLHHQVLLS